MKTAPYAHQEEALRLLAQNPTEFALGAEQGTGKTWMLLADAERQFSQGAIEGLVIVAPNGVHENWAKVEIPKHLEVAHHFVSWSPKTTKQQQRLLERALCVSADELAIFCVSFDGVATQRGRAYTAQFLQRYRCMLVVDESHLIKSPRAQRTRILHHLGRMAVARRIASGTLVADRPQDLYSQYHFLREGALGSWSYRAFVARYAEILPPEHGLVRAVRARTRGGHTPQIIARDAQDRPIYRNLDELSRRMAPLTYRVRKCDCVDLPPKIYSERRFALATEQRALYERLKQEGVAALGASELLTVDAAMALGNKLRQVTSGFVLREDGTQHLLGATPRLNSLLEVLAESDEQCIIFAHYRAELEQIEQALAQHGIGSVSYHGGVPKPARAAAVAEFQRGAARCFVANPQSAGRGLTLTAASTVIYYSHSYSLELRTQSEDRAHRIGTQNRVLYVDLVAADTIDEGIVRALKSKGDVAAVIMDGITGRGKVISYANHATGDQQ